MEDLVERNGLYYKKSSNVPFTGKVTSPPKGKIKNGKKKEGLWKNYWDNGQLGGKGNFKDGKLEGPWVNYWESGQLWNKVNYKDGKKEGLWELYNEDGSFLQ